MAGELLLFNLRYIYFVYLHNDMLIMRSLYYITFNADEILSLKPIKGVLRVSSITWQSTIVINVLCALCMYYYHYDGATIIFHCSNYKQIIETDSVCRDLNVLSVFNLTEIIEMKTNNNTSMIIFKPWCIPIYTWILCAVVLYCTASAAAAARGSRRPFYRFSSSRSATRGIRFISL